MTWPQKQCSPYTQPAETQIFTNSKTAVLWILVWGITQSKPNRRPQTKKQHNDTTYTHKCVALWVFYLQACICVGGFEKYFLSVFSYTGRTFPWSDAKPPPQNTVSTTYTQAHNVSVWVSKAWKLTLCSLKMLLPAQRVYSMLIFLSHDWCDTMVVNVRLFSDDNNIVAVAAGGCDAAALLWREFYTNASYRIYVCFFS